ncbi:META domain-containing protein [Subtercola frigoramans]|uniref:Heat shock protein HslJ n=1 Tax=Subtercola frigoramans TaxID=120298 RepID=A0ABS2L7X6_9MICO|nr:META domain-containing protein [Subtercola frigoramans]MBM7473192.1 heat shock protein HslJ [Subtercola frigoramans]
MSALKPLAAATRAVTAGLTLGVTVVMVLALAACSSPVVVPIPDAPQFTPASSSTLPGRWVVADTYSSPDQPYLAFEHDGTWKGSDGCNNAKGTWSMDSSGALTTTSGPVTRIYCDGAPLPLYLIDATSAKFDGTTLTLVGHKTDELVKLKRPSSTESPAPGGTQVVVGLWTSVENGRSRLVKLSMDEDGTVAGNDGCNDFTSTWRFAEDGTVSFGRLAITGRTCEGVVTWLSGAASAVLDGTTMVIRSTYGGQLGTLTYHGAA